MRNIFLILAVTALAGGCSTLAKPPVLKNAALAPEPLKPGDTALLTLEVQDKNRIIQRIEGTFKEGPQVTLRLRDDGEKGDAEANDGIWSLQVDVPFQAPPGSFQLDLTAYRSDGVAVPVRNVSGQIVPLTTSLPVVIHAASTAPEQ